MRRRTRIFAWSGAVIGVLLLMVLSLLAWLLCTTSGARWLAAVATRRFAPQVRYAAIDGTLAGELTVRDFRFEGDAYTAKVRIAEMTIDPSLAMLLSRTLHIEHATVHGLVLSLPENKKPDEPHKPLWVEPPLDVVVRDFALVDGRLLDGRKTVLTLRQLGIAARWSRDALVIERLSLLPGDIEGELDASGRITPEGRSLRGTLSARWRNVVVPERLAGRTLASEGSLSFEGTPGHYSARGKFDLGPPGDPGHVTLAVNGTDRELSIESLDVAQRAGRLAVNGKLTFDPAVTWDLSARADDFNPGAMLAEWPGSINLDFTTRGELAAAGPRGTLGLTHLSGELRGRPLSGKGNLEFAAPTTLAGDLTLRSGNSRVEVRGDRGVHQQIDASVELALASLGDWLPHASGSLNGRFVVRGAWPKLTIQGSADGRNLALRPGADEKSGGARVRELHVAANLSSPLAPRGDLQIQASHIEAGGFDFEGARITAAGNLGRHRATFEAHGARLDASLAVAGGVTRGGWRGELSRLKVQAPDVGSLALRAPARLVFEAGSFSISQSCFVDRDAALCVAAKADAGGAMDASYSFEHVPLGLANVLAPEVLPGQLQGELRGTGRIRRGADGRWFGDARLDSLSARLVLRGEAAAGPVPGATSYLLYENLVATVALEGTHARLRLDAALDHGGKFAASAALTDLDAAAPALRGEATATLPTLKPFGGFVPTIGNLDGSVDAKIELSGTLDAPQFTGTVEARRLQADIGQLGIELREGELHAAAARGGGFRFDGQVNSGKGRLHLDGSMSERGAVDVRIAGENFLAAGIPAANVVISPDLALTGGPKDYLLKGEVSIPVATVNLQKLPSDRAPGVSPDVVVVREGKIVESEAQDSALPLSAQIEVKLGNKVAINGYGLDATVTGQLQVRESPGSPTTGSGQLSLSGRYKAYGQDLAIREGRLLFAGTPLDNPRLSIVAMREVDASQSTGLRITGSAQRPLVTVISDPEVGQADALSYLVTGRSLNEVGGASSSSQDALASATQSLEGAAGGLVAKRIGKRLGLDEVGVEENEMIGGSALTIGEYLSPRVYLSYGIGLFQPGDVVALRYRLSDDVGIKVQRGTEETRAGVEYRIER